MSADLREKLEELESEVAYEARHQREREADSEFEEKFKHHYAAGKLEEVLASIRDLLASHEEREGEDDPLPSGVLVACPKCFLAGPVTYRSRVPSRQYLCTACHITFGAPDLRSHTDRETLYVHEDAVRLARQNPGKVVQVGLSTEPGLGKYVEIHVGSPVQPGRGTLRGRP